MCGSVSIVRVVLVFCLACGRIDFDPLCDSCGPPWELVQVGSLDNAASNNGNRVSLQPSRPGSLIAVGIDGSPSDSVASVVDDAGSSFVPIPGARAARVNGGAIDVWYAAGTSGGATSVTVNMLSGGNPGAIVVWEAANLRASGALDTALSMSSGTALSSLVVSGPEIVTTNPGEFVISIALVAGAVTRSDPGNEFANDAMPEGDGWAHLANLAAPAGPHQAVWDLDSTGTFATAAVAFFKD